jgi:hypothetical protein
MKIAILITAVIALAGSMLPASAEAQRRPTLQEQALCAAQAKKYDGEYGATFENHYNVKWQRCFVLETKREVSGGIYIGRMRLFDAFEKHVFAEMSISCGQPSYTGNPFECEYFGGPAPVKFFCLLDEGFCKTSIDFNQYVRRYIDDDESRALAGPDKELQPDDYGSKVPMPQDSRK